MMRGGSFRAHLTRLRSHYAESRDSADRVAAPPFRRGRGQRRRGGAACVLAIAGGRAGRGVLEALARRARVGVYSLASGGACEAATRRYSPSAA